jgi:hypothetical protein
MSPIWNKSKAHAIGVCLPSVKSETRVIGAHLRFGACVINILGPARERASLFQHLAKISNHAHALNCRACPATNVAVLVEPPTMMPVEPSTPSSHYTPMTLAQIQCLLSMPGVQWPPSTPEVYYRSECMARSCRASMTPTYSRCPTRTTPSLVVLSLFSSHHTCGALPYFPSPTPKLIPHLSSLFCSRVPPKPVPSSLG